IPCRNEEKFIGKCFDSIVSNDYPKEKLEVLVIDGMSEDKTKEIAHHYAQRFSFIKVLSNSEKIVPTAMNKGIKNAQGQIIIRMDAHNIYEEDYISKCVKYLQEYNADNVGGIWVTLPGDNGMIAQVIAFALTHPFGVGNAYFRIGFNKPKYVDTVPFGCYKREVFEKIGLFNESLIRNQDIEFNLRLKRAGGKILLVPDIVSYYQARSNLKDLFKQNFWNGFWVIYSIKFAEIPFSIRHLIPFFFVFLLLSSLLLSFLYNPFIYLFIFIMSIYTTTNLFFSLHISFKNGFKYLPFLVVSFLTLHFSYGLGSLWGIVRLTFSKLKRTQNT
ncbi:MAG: glycosyltransferase family 2 protein, partial [Candidatus Methanoperedens sp.]|nr:glycosyltransferase family 2 protein [Candidatus Methanoperedens sp.]